MHAYPFLVRTISFGLAVLVSSVFGLAQAQTPDPGHYSTAQYEFTVRHGVMVPMRDGARLAMNLYVPTAQRKLPAILCITPYGRSGPRSKAEWFASRGYVFAVADARGRFDSDGVWDPFGDLFDTSDETSHHKADGYDLVEWLADQSWSNGKVGMWGGSYLALAQWWTASVAPPHLAAIVPQVAPSDQFENGGMLYRNGALGGNSMPDWAAMYSGRTIQTLTEDPEGGWSKNRQEDYKRTPYSEINAYRGIENAPWFTEWYRRNKPTDDYWKRSAYQGEEHYSKVAVPSLSFTGWFDVAHSGSPANYMGMKKFGATAAARRPSLVVGPWAHRINQRIVGGIDYGPEATLDVDGYMVRWFDHYLKGIDNGVEKDAPVHVFVMGENKWYAEQDWPLPQAKPTKYYLVSGGHANSLKGDGILTTVPPRREGSDSYAYDPRNPTLDPSNGELDGAADTRISAIGDEVLIYQTPPLASPVKVIGPIEATLYAATSARDTDWMVRLVDVQPDGRTLLLADGVIRARNRDPRRNGQFNAAQLSSIESGRVYEYRITFWRGTANLFRTGHRIRVEISSSWFPFFLPNLNTGADNVAMVSISEAVVAHQTIHHGARYPSHILLPVIPTRPAGTERTVSE